MKHWSPDKPKILEFDARGEATDMLNRAIDNYYGLTKSLSSLMQRFQDETAAACSVRTLTLGSDQPDPP